MKPQVESLLRFRERFGKRVFKCLVNRNRCIGGHIRVVHTDHIKTDLVGKDGGDFFYGFI